MLLTILGLAIGFWLLYSGWKFYRNIDWNEPPEPSPDLQAMHKKEAELLHIQDVLAEACKQGKISQQIVEEFDRYCDREIEEFRAIESAWKARRQPSKV